MKQNDADSGTNNRKCEMNWQLERGTAVLARLLRQPTRPREQWKLDKRRKRRCVYGVAERKRGANDYGFKCVRIRNDRQHVGFEL